MGSHIFKQDEKAYYNYFDWCFDCKQVKGMKSNANKKTRIYLKNHFLFLICFLIRETKFVKC